MVFLLLIFFIVNATLIVVERDKKVIVPIAKYSDRQESKMGRIVINVYGDEHAAEGRFRMADGKKIFATDEDMVDFIKKQKEIVNKMVTIQGTPIPQTTQLGKPAIVLEPSLPPALSVDG